MGRRKKRNPRCMSCNLFHEPPVCPNRLKIYFRLEEIKLKRGYTRDAVIDVTADDTRLAEKFEEFAERILSQREDLP